MSIAVEHLQFAYRARPVLRDVSFCAEEGRLLAVLGPNGAGKTTLFRCVLGLLRGYQGRILVDGTEARTLSARELAHRIAYIPQIHGQAFAYSALEMVLMGTTHSISPFPRLKKRKLPQLWRRWNGWASHTLRNKIFPAFPAANNSLCWSRAHLRSRHIRL